MWLRALKPSYPLNDLSLRQDTAISGVFFWGVGWGGGLDERPRFQSTAQEVFARGQLYVVVCGTGVTATVIQVFIQPQTEVSTGKRKKKEKPWCIYEVVTRKGCKKYNIWQVRIQVAGRGKWTVCPGGIVGTSGGGKDMKLWLRYLRIKNKFPPVSSRQV